MGKIVNVILSGGVGSRLWPLSRKSKPKQYLPIFSGKSLFELAVTRNLKVAQEVLLVASESNLELANPALQGVSHRIIVESVPRNTAAAIAFAAFALEEDDVMLVTPSDHLVENQEDYKSAIEQGVEFAKMDNIVTFGIVPHYPETGYGYIEHEGNDVISFREKPNESTAKEFLQRKRFLWNSGIFCFKAGVFLEELERYSPAVFSAAKEAFQNCKEDIIDKDLSLAIPSISVDYAVMEKSDRIKVIPAKFKWSDMGAFDSLYEHLKDNGQPIDENGNMVIGDTDKQVAFVGMKDTIVVSTDDALLVLDMNSAQKVKDLYESLQENNSDLIE